MEGWQPVVTSSPGQSIHSADDADSALEPFPVDQLNLAILRGYRTKVFALLIVQSFILLGVTLLSSALVAAVGAPHDAVVIVFGVLVVLSLGGLARVRHLFPWNYVAWLVFAVICGTTAGIMTGSLKTVLIYLPGGRASSSPPPQIVCLIMHTSGIFIIALLAMARFTKKMMKCLPCSIVAMVLVNLVLVLWWVNTRFCPTSWLLAMMFVVSGSLFWVGVENDRLASKLRPDEYMLPSILMWADLFMVVLALIAGCVFACVSATGDCGQFEAFPCFPSSGCGECCLYGDRQPEHGGSLRRVIPQEEQADDPEPSSVAATAVATVAAPVAQEGVGVNGRAEDLETAGRAAAATAQPGEVMRT